MVCALCKKEIKNYRLSGVMSVPLHNSVPCSLLWDVHFKKENGEWVINKAEVSKVLEFYEMILGSRIWEIDNRFQVKTNKKDYAIIAMIVNVLREKINERKNI